MVGWKRPVSDRSALVGDLVIRPGGERAYELSWQTAIGSALTLGPGISYADATEGPRWSIGFVLQYTFNTGGS